jgi:hypothetical protein
VEPIVLRNKKSDFHVEYQKFHEPKITKDVSGIAALMAYAIVSSSAKVHGRILCGYMKMDGC